MKKIIALLLTAMMLFAVVAFVPTEVLADDLEWTVIFAQVPEDWESPHFWAWGPRGDAFPSWPGGEMEADPENPGWYFIHLPADKTGGLINANGGSIQTGDFPLDDVPLWVTVMDEEELEATTIQQTTGDLPVPILPVIIFAQVPDDWEAPHFWAWGPRGNAFPSWPGAPMHPDPGNPGWYFIHIPADKTGAIVNANGGTIQTNDFPFEGTPLWVTVNPLDDPEDEDEEITFEVTDIQQTTGAFPAYIPYAPPAGPTEAIQIEGVVVYVQIPEDWETPRMWAWGPRGDAFDAWPGEELTPDANNPGWYYIFLPYDKTGALINADLDGETVQTSDFPFEGTPLWVMINPLEDPEDDVTFEVTDDQQTSGALPVMEGGFTAYVIVAPPEAPDVGMIALRAHVYAPWINPGVWAWNDGDGYGDVFSGWPGPQFTETDGVWHIMHLPAWTDHIIINAVSGAFQTVDIPVEVGQDIWIAVVDGDGLFYLSYSEFDPYELDPDLIEAPPLPERAEEVVFGASAAMPTPAPAPPPVEDENGAPVGLIVGIGAGVCAVVGGGAYALMKKRGKKEDS